jgi:hypothetical protein
MHYPAQLCPAGHLQWEHAVFKKTLCPVLLVTAVISRVSPVLVAGDFAGSVAPIPVSTPTHQFLGPQALVTVPGTGQAQVIVSASAGLGATANSEWSVDICYQEGSGTPTPGPSPVIYKQPDNGGILRPVSAHRIISVGKDTAYCIGLCIRVVSGNAGVAPSFVQGTYLAF